MLAGQGLIKKILFALLVDSWRRVAERDKIEGPGGPTHSCGARRAWRLSRACTSLALIARLHPKRSSQSDSLSHGIAPERGVDFFFFAKYRSDPLSSRRTKKIQKGANAKKAKEGRKPGNALKVGLQKCTEFMWGCPLGGHRAKKHKKGGNRRKQGQGTGVERLLQVLGSSPCGFASLACPGPQWPRAAQTTDSARAAGPRWHAQTAGPS